MTLSVVPHAPEWRNAVRALNARMAPHGGFGFFEDPVPGWLPPAPGRSTYREYFVAVEDSTWARGGYVLKREPALVAGSERTVACVQGPYSEGAVDRRHAGVVFAMVRDMVARQPLLYGWGLERRAGGVVRLFQALGWQAHATPVLARLGLPALARARERRRRGSRGETCEEVAAFGSWADELWARCGRRYAFVVRRDRVALNDLYPAAIDGFRRLVVHRDGEVVGWAVVGVRTFSGHPRFRSARVGVLWDFFADPDDAAAVARAARRHLAQLGAWAMLASASHDAWIAALAKSGFRLRPQRRYLLVSKPLAVALDPFSSRAEQSFLTFGDGEGHHGSLGREFFAGPT